jgi:transcriptional regulator with XRE-family HTH domain
MGRISWHGGSASTRVKSPLAEHIGKQILKVRDKRQISMREAAEMCGVSLTFFCDMENGKTIPGADTLLKLSNGFGTGVSYWFKGFSVTPVSP